MDYIGILILVSVAVLFFLAVRASLKKKNGCAGCSGCTGCSDCRRCGGGSDRHGKK